MYYDKNSIKDEMIQQHNVRKPLFVLRKTMPNTVRSPMQSSYEKGQFGKNINNQSMENIKDGGMTSGITIQLIWPKDSLLLPPQPAPSYSDKLSHNRR
ncbi:unnamed protein product [Macrosiphum euphorbiae]|uniref:Uncharacterized protein n=1 Tax=Macrosiphum euphorbiae TaxID=13131 RepID=A0AAV0VQB8_9HEMI|nr:unnamed protein product [Macrosiphum euphorbiae]